jgi:hypothetical protein
MSDVCNRCKQPLVDGRCPNATPETIEDERDALRARVAELEQERDNWHASFIAEYESASVELIRDSLALAESQRDAALASAALEAQHHNHLRAERDSALERLRVVEPVYEAAVAWSESFGELSKRLPPHVHRLRNAIAASTNPDKAGK